jgi:2-dehydropantoate 2-reductase
MKILVFVAGVQGSRLAAALQEASLLAAGQQVTLLARDERARQIRQYGIVLEAANTGAVTTVPIPLVETLQPDDAYDLVLVPVRSNQVKDVLPVLAANRHTPNVLFLGNNIHGPGEIIQALGRERVLMGFAGIAGTRSGHAIRYIHANSKAAIYVGELDGQITPRLREIQAVFAHTRYPVTIEKNILAWLYTHVAVVSPVAYALYMCGGDTYRLAATPDALVLMLRAIREGFRALKTLDYPIVPEILDKIVRIPEPVFIPLLKRVMNTQFAEISAAGHANAARDEMEHLADGLWRLVQTSGISAPALERLYAYRDPAQPQIPENSREISLNQREMRPLLTGLAAAALLGLATGILIKSQRRKRS